MLSKIYRQVVRRTDAFQGGLKILHLLLYKGGGRQQRSAQKPRGVTGRSIISRPATAMGDNRPICPQARNDPLGCAP
jgi:hypothetical protein